MSANDLLQLVNQLLYGAIFVATAVQALHRPRRATVDAALLFGDTALIVASTWAVRALGSSTPDWLTEADGALLMATPYLLLRLVDGFTDVPLLVMRAVEAGLMLGVVGLFLLPQPLSVSVTLAYVAYYLAVELYATILVVRTATRAAGVTRRRLHAVAAGSLFLALLLLTAGLQAALPGLSALWTVLSQALGFASGVGFIVGFATPGWVRRAWQEPELRALLARAADFTRLPDAAAIVREIERGAAAAVGTGRAAVGLWDEEAGVLRWDVEGGRGTTRPGEMTVGRAFAQQRALFSAAPVRGSPDWRDAYDRHRVGAMMAAPMTVRHKRLGVLVAYAERAPIFAEDDLALVQLLADQAAVILESRALIDEAARVQAEAEANRLREDFLSAAAHDLKTPLTAIVGRAQLLRTRVGHLPDAPAALVRDADAIVAASERLRTLAQDLLDAARVEQGSLVGERDMVDLTTLAREVCARHATPRHPCDVEADAPVVGAVDPPRVAQMLDNLLENAVKYSPEGGRIAVRVWAEDGVARLSVVDQGIGIPPTDLPHLFDRFRRASNTDDGHVEGDGLGLYLCRGIAEGHGGRIWAESAPGAGSTFHVALPPRRDEIPWRTA